jgi:hypothetical protein
LNSTSSTRAGEPAARNRFSHADDGVRIAVAIFARVSGLLNRL